MMNMKNPHNEKSSFIIHHSSFARSQSGVALVIVLMVVAILAAAVTELLFSSKLDMSLSRNYADEQQAHYCARSGVEVAEVLLERPDWGEMLEILGVEKWADDCLVREEGSITQKEQAPGEEASILESLHYTDGECGNRFLRLNPVGLPIFSEDPDLNDDFGLDIKFYDESGKFNLNALVWFDRRKFTGFTNHQTHPVNVVLRDQIGALMAWQLILSADLDREAAEDYEAFIEDKIEFKDIIDMLAALIDWLDEDDDITALQMPDGTLGEGAESDYYRMLEEPYEIRNGPLETLGELRLVKGFDAEIYEKLAPYLTVYPQIPEDARRGLTDKRDVYSDRVNLDTAADTVLRAFFWGGGKRGPNPNQAITNFQDPKFTKEKLDEIVIALDCYRMGFGPAENESYCRGLPTAATSGASLNDQLQNVLNFYPIANEGFPLDIPNKGHDRTGSGGGSAARPGNRLKPNKQQKDTDPVGSYVTVKVIGEVGLMNESEYEGAVRKEITVVFKRQVSAQSANRRRPMKQQAAGGVKVLYWKER